jgi:serine/threonine-protein kinase
MFLSSSGNLPAVFSRVKVTIPSAGNLGVLAEVVRHVPPDQARAWNMAPGFGVQFVEVTPQLRESLTRLTQGLNVVPKVVPPQIAAAVDNVLHKWRDRMNGDHYVIIGATPDVDLADVRTKGSDALRELAQLKDSSDTTQRAQIDAAVARVQAAIDVLSVPGPRARFDSNRGNFRGVARCIMGGLGPLDLERLRQEHLAHHPTSAGAAHVKFLASKGFESNNQIKEALDACEAALQLDPLNLQLHQRHASLARRVKDTGKA